MPNKHVKHNNNYEKHNDLEYNPTGIGRHL